MNTKIDLSADIIDLRDIIARIEELRSERDEETKRDGGDGNSRWAAENPEDAEELAALEDIMDELAGYGGDEQWDGDWYPLTLISEGYFIEYAKELAEDIGAIDKNAAWPARHIDWEAAANELQGDYSSVEINGTTYWYR